MILKVNSCFASEIKNAIDFVHFSNQYTTAMVRIFLLKYFEAIALKSIEVFDFKSCHHKIFFPRTSISTNVKIFWKNHFIMSKSLYI